MDQFNFNCYLLNFDHPEFLCSICLCYIFPIVEMFTLNWIIPVEFALFDWFFLFVSRRSLEDLCVVFRDWVSDISSSSCRECLLISGACSDCLANVACVCVCFFVVLLLLGFFSKMFLRFLWQQSMQFIVAEQILFLFINLFVISRISVSFSTSLCLYTYISSVPPQVFF